MKQRLPLIALAVAGIVAICIGAAAPFIQVEIFQSGYGLRGQSTNLFKANSNLLNSAVNLSARQPASSALTNAAAGGPSTNFFAGDGAYKVISTNWITGLVSDIANLVTAISGKQTASAQLTTDANNTGGTSTNFRSGDGTFKQVTTNMVPGLNALIAAQEPLNANKYQATNPSLTTLAGGNGSPLTTGIAASAITSGSIDTNRLPATAALTDKTQTFTAPQTFTNQVTLGGIGLSNWPLSPWFLSEWAIYYNEFPGSTAAANESQIVGSALNGGTRWITTESLGVHPGVAYFQTATFNGTSGYSYFLYNNTLPKLTSDNFWRWDWKPYNTNGVISRAGWGSLAATTDPTDGSFLTCSNGVLQFVNINNSTKSFSDPIIVPATTWATTIMWHTNGSPYSAFYHYTNGVLWTNCVVSNFPTNRTACWSAGSWAVSAPATNAGAAVMMFDAMLVGVSTKGYR